MIEVGIDKKLRERWLKIDGAFKRKIVEDSFEAFMDTKWPYKKHIIIPKPQGF